jgi:hypothetical protein
MSDDHVQWYLRPEEKGRLCSTAVTLYSVRWVVGQCVILLVGSGMTPSSLFCIRLIDDRTQAWPQPPQRSKQRRAGVGLGGWKRRAVRCCGCSSFTEGPRGAGVLTASVFEH